ncbi:MAG: TraR/DksA C4-type zinc finger protein [Prolixibacteraceae bacterium]|nr:TraR/DksA C4-type zinc finger protein [Prolixibacteraceae bacterium]
MSINDKIAIKQALEKKLDKLTRDIIELKELTRPEAPDSAIGRVSRMDAINNRSINESALRKKRIQLSKIETAIKDFDQPGFGKCIRCGKTIQVARILLMPESKVCVNCAG